MTRGVHVIAEAGTNHGGRLATALDLVDHAAAAGADSVKVQIIYPEGLYLPAIREAGVTAPNEVFEKRRAGMLADADYPKLAAHCRAKGIALSASVFDERGLDLLCALDPPYVKIASCDLNHSRLLRAAAKRGRKMIVSTGMSTLAEIERAVEDIWKTGHRDVVLLHCVSVYPCPTERTNLGFLTTLASAFGLPVGLSDHTESSVAGAAAIALGATWIEKHFTLDRRAEGFDHAYAMEPEGLASYVRDLRAVTEACRRPANKLADDEVEVRRRARRSLYAARDVEPGEILAEKDVLVVRPEGELAPNDLPRFLGKKLRRAIRAFEAITPGAFC